MATIGISRGNTLPDSSGKADFHNLIDTATLSLSDIVNADINTNAAIANSKLNLAAIAQAVAMSSKQFLFAKGADVASATSITLGTDGNCFDITGTTNIQTIAVKQAGSVVILHFDGALTLVDDTGNLELGGQNLSISAEDEVILKCDGTNWHLVSASTRLTSLDYEFVSTTAISNDATVAVTGLAAGYDYIFSFQNLEPQNDSDVLQAVVGTGATPTYQATLYTDYSDTGGTFMQLSGAVGNAANECITTDITVLNPAAEKWTLVNTNPGGRIAADGAYAGDYGIYGGAWLGTTAVTAIRFNFSTGNMDLGTLNVFRRKLS